MFNDEMLEAMKWRGVCFFGGGGTRLPPPPPLPPQRDDPAIIEARKKQRSAELRRKGRASTILSGGAGLVGETPLSRPQALGA